MTALRVVKVNKRLMIFDDSDRRVYCPPDYVRVQIKSRAQMQELCDQLNSGVDYIDAVMAFESAIHQNWKKK